MVEIMIVWAIVMVVVLLLNYAASKNNKRYDADSERAFSELKKDR